MRPQSIEKFDLFYLISLAIGAGAFLLGYEELVIQMRSELAGSGVEMGGGLLIASFAFSMAISVLLWYLVSKKANVIAKWVLVAFFAIGLISIPTLFETDFTLATGLNLVATALSAVAVWYLFQKDAKVWFDPEDTPNIDTSK